MGAKGINHKGHKERKEGHKEFPQDLGGAFVAFVPFVVNVPARQFWDTFLKPCELDMPGADIPSWRHVGSRRQSQPVQT